MKNVFKLAAVLLCFFTSVTVCAIEEVSTPLQVDLTRPAFKMDGKASDWAGIPAVTKELGGKRKGKQPDVGEVYIASDSNYVYFMLTVRNISSNSKTPFFKIGIDKDAKTKTGATRAGLEYRISLGAKKGDSLFLQFEEFPSKNISNSQQTAFVTSAKSYDLARISSNKLEFRIPRSYFNSGKLKSHLLLLETDSGSPLKVKLNESSAKEKSALAGMSMAWTLLIGLGVVTSLCGFAICARVGVEPMMAALALIPYIGAVIMLMVVAFGKWPLFAEIEKVEESLS